MTETVLTRGAMSGDAAHSPADGLPAARRRWAMLALMTGVSMASLDTAIANTALPELARQLHAGAAASVWIVNIYQLAMVATLLPFAALGERVGYRRVATAGLALFTVASLLCALAWNLPLLVGARLLQGLGAAALMGVTTAMMRAIYPAHLQGQGFGLNALVVAVAFAVGPTFASLILALASWPWLFAINVPIGAAAFVLARRVLPDNTRGKHGFDAGAALCNVGAFGFLILLLGDAAHGVSPARLGLEAAATIACFVLLLRRQHGHAAPILPTDLLARPLFALSALTAVCTFAVQSLAFVALPFHFEQVLGRSPVETGFLLTPWPVLVGIMGPISGRLSDRYESGLLAGIGLLVLCAGMAALLWMPDAPSTVAIAWRMAVCGIGFGLFQAPNMKAIMGSAPRERAGGASGIVATARLTGQACGAALVAGCLVLSEHRGTTYALAAAAAIALLGAAISFARLHPRTKG
ncbi:MFS transporter [Telluria mixta]|uniref:MFS transporter n=1 Tax=Telluria mixta TaxID=34071 RepID=A0ABT2C5J5_9BURK|nr:MFS transporter [Telluria mixta]MCS0632639.1 MFS transporter [Telluria mixta]WEM99067.1 MFS transporter [Telluria mixta]